MSGPVLLSSCPVCDCDDYELVLRRKDVPIRFPLQRRAGDKSTVIHHHGQVELAQCHACSLVYNRRFNESVIDHCGDFKDVQQLSARSQSYLAELAGDLRHRFSLNQSRILEIGCGDGEFLKHLTLASASHGVGFEPSAPHDCAAGHSSIQVHPRVFNAFDAVGQYELACLRHVLEHVPEPLPVLALVTNALRPNGGNIYVEVSNGARNECYEQCLYFNARSLRQLLISGGFDAVEVEERSGGQVLAGYGTACNVTSSEPAIHEVRSRAA